MLKEIKENLEKLVESTEEMNKLLETMIDEINKDTIILKSKTDKNKYEYSVIDCCDKY